MRRLNDWIEKRTVISECQMGFGKGIRMTNKVYLGKFVDLIARGFVVETGLGKRYQRN